MPFSFLNPWLWFGALAVGVPIWLHLRRKKQTNLLRFSAVRFLEDQPEPKRSPMRPRDILLLLLRALAVLLIVAAFAWPFLHGLNTVPIEESRVYILDNTFSRQANDGFLRDKQRVIDEVTRARPDLQSAVIELTSGPKLVASFADTREAALENLRALRPSFDRGAYLAAFRQANAILANSLGRQKRIVFLTDNQENQWNEAMNTPPFLRNVQLEVPPPPEASLPNLSLSDARVQRIFLGDRSLVNFTVKLSHVGPAKSANLLLRANGQSILNRAVTLENQPETILLQAQWEGDPGSAVRGEVAVDGTPDALPADNRVFFSLPPVLEGKVALLAQSPYLRVALSPEIMRGEWAARLLQPTELQRELASTDDADVLCIESTFLQSSDARKLLHRYLSNGRGVLLLVNRSTPAIDGCLRELGFESQGTVRAESEPEKFQFVMSNHPIFHPFLSPDFGNLMDIRVAEYTRLKTTEAMPLVFAEKGAALVFQATKSQGKLFVCAFGLDRDHTSWPIHQSFIPFLDLTLQAARAEDPIPSTFEPGEVANLQFPTSLAGREVVVLNQDRQLARAAVEQHGRVRLRVPETPGIYDLALAQGESMHRMLCVNPSAKESQLTFKGSGETARMWQVTGPVETAKVAPPARLPFRLAGVLQQRFWWWMVSCGLAALLLETVWAASKRDRA